MGLKNLFKKSAKAAKSFDFYMPITGALLPLEKVPDPVFSEKMMGDGFAIEPTEGKVYAPIAGTVFSIFPTKHAIALKTHDDLEILIHFGIDTVALGGVGFTIHIEKDQPITPGELLLEVNIEAVKTQVPSLITPIIFTNLNQSTIQLKKNGHLVHGEGDILEIK